jgi:hypothetical protein
MFRSSECKLRDGIVNGYGILLTLSLQFCRLKSVAAKLHPPQIRWEPTESNKIDRDELASLGTKIYDVIQELLLLMLLRFRQQAAQSSEKKVVGFTLDYIHFEELVRFFPIAYPLACPMLTKFSLGTELRAAHI